MDLDPRWLGPLDAAAESAADDVLERHQATGIANLPRRRPGVVWRRSARRRAAPRPARRVRRGRYRRTTKYAQSPQRIPTRTGLTFPAISRGTSAPPTSRPCYAPPLDPAGPGSGPAAGTTAAGSSSTARATPRDGGATWRLRQPRQDGHLPRPPPRCPVIALTHRHPPTSRFAAGRVPARPTLAHRPGRVNGEYHGSVWQLRGNVRQVSAGHVGPVGVGRPRRARRWPWPGAATRATSVRGGAGRVPASSATG